MNFKIKYIMDRFIGLLRLQRNEIHSNFRIRLKWVSFRLFLCIHVGSVLSEVKRNGSNLGKKYCIRAIYMRDSSER